VKGFIKTKVRKQRVSPQIKNHNIRSNVRALPGRETKTPKRLKGFHAQPGSGAPHRRSAPSAVRPATIYNRTRTHEVSTWQEKYVPHDDSGRHTHASNAARIILREPCCTEYVRSTTAVSSTLRNNQTSRRIYNEKKSHFLTMCVYTLLTAELYIRKLHGTKNQSPMMASATSERN
jgi:hypothetical protein